MPESKDTTPIHILTGFLGSGKTTLLNKLLASAGLADTAALINEFGEIGLDHLLVDTVDEEIILLESGCVCCSVRDNFITSLLTLHHKREQGTIPFFRRVILETTGIADPIAIHELILADNEVRSRYHCEKIHTVVDAVYGSSNLDTHIEAVKQVSVADQIFLSKTEISNQKQTRILGQRIQALNPAASVTRSMEPSFSPEALWRDDNKTSFSPGARRGQSGGYGGKASHDQRFSTFLLSWPEAVVWDDFTAWLEALLIARGDSIHRLKGLLKVAGEARPVVVQGVQHSFYPPTKLNKWPRGAAKTELVFITSDFNKQAAINSLADILEVTAA